MMSSHGPINLCSQNAFYVHLCLWQLCCFSFSPRKFAHLRQFEDEKQTEERFGAFMLLTVAALGLHGI